MQQDTPDRASYTKLADDRNSQSSTRNSSRNSVIIPSPFSMNFKTRLTLDAFLPFPPVLSPYLRLSTPRRKFPPSDPALPSPPQPPPLHSQQQIPETAIMASSTPAETPAFHNPSTRRLRNTPISPAQLPPHPLLDNASSTTDLTAFIHETLSEALAFTDTLMHSQFQSKGAPKTSAPATAPVQLLTLDLQHNASASGADASSGNGKKEAETWFGRRSTHADAATSGTASYAEFEAGLFDEHSVNEGHYTPDIYDTRSILSYTAGAAGEGAGLKTEEMEELRNKGWTDVHADLYEMAHQLPAPLQPRVFAVLVVRAKVASGQTEGQTDGQTAGQSATGFITAQLPLDLSRSKSAFYANGRNEREGDSKLRKKAVVLGSYVSVERVRRQGNTVGGQAEGKEGEVVWEMATASDAGGNLPMWAQKMGVPGAVVKDVGLFVKWCGEERRKGEGYRWDWGWDWDCVKDPPRGR